MVFPMPICYVKRKLDHKKVNKKTEKEIPHDGEIKEVKEMSIVIDGGCRIIGPKVAKFLDR